MIDEVGGLDEELSTRYHLDWCLRVAQAGHTLWFEPSAVVHYLPGPPKDWRDAHFYMLRWSDAWERRASSTSARSGISPTTSSSAPARPPRLAAPDDRHRPDLPQVLPGKLGGAAVRAVKPPERVLNRIITRRHARARARTHA